MSDIIFSTLPGEGGHLGEIVLNRPKALNALTLSMCEAIHIQLEAWQADDSIKAVLIRGEGERAFCAGGDIRQIYSNGMANAQASEYFFKIEYRMNCAIFHFTKPYISLLDGITMGGGVGVSLHGSHRVATERLLFAMPEAGIGLFPDIGGGYFLSRLPDSMGCYLGLTGDRLGAEDSLALGLVTQVIDSKKQADLIRVLCESSFDSTDGQAVSDIIEAFSITPEAGKLSSYQALLSEDFSHSSVEAILEALGNRDAEWAKTLRATLLRNAPTSLKVTLEQLRRAKSMEFNDVMQMEFNMVNHFLRSPNFYEGVRAAVIDKDQSPNWQPPILDQVSDEVVSQYFEPWS